MNRYAHEIVIGDFIVADLAHKQTGVVIAIGYKAGEIIFYGDFGKVFRDPEELIGVRPVRESLSQWYRPERRFDSPPVTH